MKRSTAPWTTAIAAAAIFALPVGGWAQQTSPSTPSSSTSRPAGAETGQQGSAHEHLRQAKTALNDIPVASLTGTAKTRVAELKRHLTSLEQSAGAGEGASATRAAESDPRAGAQRSKDAWSSDAAAADRILTELLGAQAASGATEPAGPTGTTGAAGASTQTSGRIALDETTRAKLLEVRAHLTAFAASMNGSRSSSSPSEPEAGASTSTPQASAASSANPSAPASPAQAEAAPAPANPTEPTPAEPAAPRQTAEPASDPASATPTGTSGTATEAAQSSPAQAGASTHTPSSNPAVDPDTVKRHLTAARNALSQLTQLPAAAQLTGDTRTQVSQLISSFNELITTNIDWRGAYAKVEGNLNTLIGDQRTDESTTPTANPQAAAAAPSTTSLDPAIRAKLVEMRAHLVEFEKAAAGSGASASSMSPSASTAVSSTTAAEASTASETAASTAAPTASPASAAQAPTSSSSTTTENPAPAATTGSTASTPSPAGTSGTTTAEAQGQSPSPGAKSGSAQAADSDKDKQAGHAEAMRHIEAIEAILSGGSANKATGTSGSASSANRSGPATPVSSLDRAQIEQIRTHLNELRRAISQR